MNFESSEMLQMHIAWSLTEAPDRYGYFIDPVP